MNLNKTWTSFSSVSVPKTSHLNKLNTRIYTLNPILHIGSHAVGRARQTQTRAMSTHTGTFANAQTRK